MKIEQFSDEHGIYVCASEELFLVTKEEAASIRKHIDELHAELTDLRLGSCPSCGIKVENERLRELCVEALGWLRWAGGITCPPEVPDEFADELRELGVGV